MYNPCHPTSMTTDKRDDAPAHRSKPIHPGHQKHTITTTSLPEPPLRLPRIAPHNDLPPSMKHQIERPIHLERPRRAAFLTPWHASATVLQAGQGHHALACLPPTVAHRDHPNLMGGGPKSMASMRPPRQGIVGPPSSQLHRVPEAIALAYLCRRAVGPKVRTGTKPRVAASSSPITARVVHGGCRDHLRPQRRGVPPRLGLGLLPRPPSTAASNSKLEDERVPSTAFGAGGRRHRGQHR
jgi:hypothetical protein